MYYAGVAMHTSLHCKLISISSLMATKNVNYWQRFAKIRFYTPNITNLKTKLLNFSHCKKC